MIADITRCCLRQVSQILMHPLTHLPPIVNTHPSYPPVAAVPMREIFSIDTSKRKCSTKHQSISKAGG